MGDTLRTELMDSLAVSELPDTSDDLRHLERPA